MKDYYKIIATLFLTIGLLGAYQVSAQCATDEIEIEIFIETDSYGSEGFWSLVEGNSNCGVNQVASGGNSAVGCNGGGVKAQPAGGYGNVQNFSAGKWCIKRDSIFTLHSIDDWGDGGFGYTIKANGYEILAVDSKSANESWSFLAKEPPSRDVEMLAINTPYVYSASGNTTVSATFKNRGKLPVNTIDVYYSLNGGSIQNAPLTGLNVPYGETYKFNHPTTFNIANGNHVIKVWAANVNNGADSIPANDTLTFSFEVGSGIPNIIDQYLTTAALETEIINQFDNVDKPTDLDFHPVLSKRELWVINKRTENQGGSTVTIANAGEVNQTSVHKIDGNSWHFMSLPTGIAFGENTNFGSSPGAFDSNHDGGSPFTGPSLWSSDPNIYAQPSGGNGSHLDMLHNSPKSQGIAHEIDNVYWVFDGHNSDIVRYDFQEDHGPGASYHGDAIVHRYRDHSVAMDPQEKVVSHLVLHKSSNWLYVVDHGNKKVMRLKITTGTKGANSNINNYEQVKEYKEINNYTWETVVDSGLQKPAGIDVIGDRMIVSDYATGDIIIYAIGAKLGKELGRIPTTAQGIMGVKVGPDGHIWYVDHDANKVIKLEGNGIGINENLKIDFTLYPNPSNGNFSINLKDNSEVNIEITNILGQSVFNNSYTSSRIQIEQNLSPGVYFVSINDYQKGATSVEKIIVQ